MLPFTILIFFVLLILANGTLTFPNLGNALFLRPATAQHQIPLKICAHNLGKDAHALNTSRSSKIPLRVSIDPGFFYYGGERCSSSHVEHGKYTTFLLSKGPSHNKLNSTMPKLSKTLLKAAGDRNMVTMQGVSVQYSSLHYNHNLPANVAHRTCPKPVRCATYKLYEIIFIRLESTVTIPLQGVDYVLKRGLLYAFVRDAYGICILRDWTRVSRNVVNATSGYVRAVSPTQWNVVLMLVCLLSPLSLIVLCYNSAFLTSQTSEKPETEVNEES